jgi:hypothetical protein
MSSTSMTNSPCAWAGFATGALIGFILEIWLFVIGDHGFPLPTVGEAILAGFAVGLVAAALFAFLAALHGRLRFWSLFPPMLLVAILTGIASALLARSISPPLAVALLAPLIGYLLGLIFCLLCGRLGFKPMEAPR